MTLFPSLADLESSAMLGKEEFDQGSAFLQDTRQPHQWICIWWHTDLAMPPMIAKKILKDSGISVADYEVARTFVIPLQRHDLCRQRHNGAERVLRGLTPDSEACQKLLGQTLPQRWKEVICSCLIISASEP